MENKTISIHESGLNLRDGSNMILKIIDNQINNYKLQFQTDWEKNHSISPAEKNKKVKKLEALRNQIIQSVKDFDAEDGEVSFTLNLDVQVKTKAMVEELVA